MPSTRQNPCIGFKIGEGIGVIGELGAVSHPRGLRMALPVSPFRPQGAGGRGPDRYRRFTRMQPRRPGTEIASVQMLQERAFRINLVREITTVVSDCAALAAAP